MEADIIMAIIVGAGFLIGIVSFFVWDLSKNKKIAKFFRKIADWIGENWRW